MKKLEKIIEQGTFAANPEFQKLLAAYQSARENLQTAKENFHQKRDKFSEKDAAKDSDDVEVFHLLAAAQIAKFHRSIRRVEVAQAKFDLKNWLRQNKSDMEKPTDEKQEKKKKTAEATAPAELPKPSRKRKEKPEIEK